MQQREPKLRRLVKTGVPSAGGDVQASRPNQGRSILWHTLYLLNVLAARESFAYLKLRLPPALAGMQTVRAGAWRS